MSIRSSEKRSRSQGATAAPTRDPAPVTPATTPRCQRGSSRRSKRRSSVRKPTIPRTSAMAVDASTTPMLRSSAVSAALGGAIATWVAGMRSAARVPTRYTTTATPRMPCDPASAYAGAARRPAAGSGQAREQLQLGVGLDELLVVAHHGGHEGAAGHAVGLAEGQHGERLGEQQQAVEVVEHHEADDGPHAVDGDHHPAAAAVGPVEGRPDEGGHEGQRGDREEQVEEDLPAGLVGVEVEEERAGQGQRDQGVAQRREHVGAGQPGERREAEGVGARPAPGRGQRLPPGRFGHHPIVRMPSDAPGQPVATTRGTSYL